MTFDPRIARAIADAEKNKQEVGALSEYDMRDLDFPLVPLYGHDHAFQTSMLAANIAESLSLPPKDVLIARTAAYFHDYRRAEEWFREDPNHALRSAEEAERVLRRRGEDASVVEEVCRLIARHRVGNGFDPQGDPRAKALHDADALEAARFEPGTPRGARLFKERTANLFTEYAKRRDVREVWLSFRGWRG